MQISIVINLILSLYFAFISKLHCTTLDFEENSPFQEGVILEAYQIPDKSFSQEL